MLLTLNLSLKAPFLSSVTEARDLLAQPRAPHRRLPAAVPLKPPQAEGPGARFGLCRQSQPPLPLALRFGELPGS